MIRLHGKQRKGWASVAKLSMGSRWIRNFAGVAQLVEHRICNPKVKGSSPLASSDAQPGPVALTEAQSLTLQSNSPWAKAVRQMPKPTTIKAKYTIQSVSRNLPPRG